MSNLVLKEIILQGDQPLCVRPDHSILAILAVPSFKGFWGEAPLGLVTSPAAEDTFGRLRRQGAEEGVCFGEQDVLRWDDG